MKKLLYGWILLLMPFVTFAQGAGDAEALIMADQMPRFPGCEEQGLAHAELKNCSDRKMLEFVYQNIQYPDSARAKDIEGTVVIRFVVMQDGSVDYAQIVKEIGGGCGAEALRVVKLMNEQGIKWIPGKNKGEAVKVYFNLPIKYKLEKESAPLPYFVVGPDTIYTEYEVAPVFGTEAGALQKYMDALPYPKGVDSCLAGSMATQFYISKDGGVKIGELYDYSDLGFDFQFEAIQHLNATNLKWKAAQRGGEAVNCYLPLRLNFIPPGEACKSVADNFESAYATAGEAENLYADEQVAEAIEKWSESLRLLPGNAEMLLLRGQAYLEINEKEKACSDLQTAKKSVPLAAWVEQVLPMICQ